MEIEQDNKIKISILTPSRSRPSRLKTFILSVFKTSFLPERLEFLNYIDDDDPDIQLYKETEEEIRKISHNKIVFKNFYQKPMSVSRSWNILASNCTGDIMIMGNDDLIYQTQNWDKILIEETRKFKDEIYLMWFDDGVKKHNHANFPIISRKWYETLGYFTPGCFNFGFNDTWLFELGLNVKRAHYIDTVKISHNTFKQDKTLWDSTYARNRTKERGNLYEKDREVWLNTHFDRVRETIKLINVIEKNGTNSPFPKKGKINTLL